MRFCKVCKALCFDESLPFDRCKHKLSEIKDINEPVRLCVIGGTERAMLTGMLKDADIPYIEENVHPRGVANEIVTGYDVKLSNISLVVPFSSLPKAGELLNTIGTVKNDIDPHMDEIKAEISRLHTAKDNKEDKPMSPALRTTIRVITALLFLALVALAVFGTDALTDLIKGLF